MEALESMVIKKLSYRDIINLVPSFVSLDISVSATGWVKWVDGKLTQGVYAITAPSGDDLGRRKEFREFLKNIFGEDDIETLYIEDVIGSVNFETAKILYQLNPIADDMVDDGILKVKTIKREDNNKWKRYLRLCAGYKSEIRGNTDVKQMIQDCLHILDFGADVAGTPDDFAEGTYDAMGMAVGTIYRDYVLQESKKPVKLKKDVSKGYVIEQYFDEYTALERANTLKGEIHQLNFMEIKRDLKFNFKKTIEDLKVDNKLFVVSILTCKIGALALEKKLDLTKEVSYLLIYRKKR